MKHRRPADASASTVNFKKSLFPCRFEIPVRPRVLYPRSKRRGIRRTECYPGKNTCLPGLLQLDLHVNTRCQIEFHQSIDGLWRGIQDVEQTLVGADLELLP